MQEQEEDEEEQERRSLLHKVKQQLSGPVPPLPRHTPEKEEIKEELAPKGTCRY